MEPYLLIIHHEREVKEDHADFWAAMMTGAFERMRLKVHYSIYENDSGKRLFTSVDLLIEKT